MRGLNPDNNLLGLNTNLWEALAKPNLTSQSKHANKRCQTYSRLYRFSAADEIYWTSMLRSKLHKLLKLVRFKDDRVPQKNSLLYCS